MKRKCPKCKSEKITVVDDQHCKCEKCGFVFNCDMIDLMKELNDWIK